MSQKRTRRGTKAGAKAKYSVSTQQAFTGDSCNMKQGTQGNGGYWLYDQVPIAHVGATEKLHYPILEHVFKDLSYYDKFAPRSVGTYDWGQMA